MKPTLKDSLLLVLVSFLALYFEIALIRWLPGQTQSVGYFTNLVLISSFLGLGIGCATPARGKDPARSFAMWMLVLCGVSLAFGLLGEAPLGLGAEEFQSFTDKIGLVPPFLAAIVVYVLTALAMVPLGRMIGARMNLFAPLPGYSLNILGSLLGVSAMAVIRHWSLGPVSWFGLGFLLFIPFIAEAASRRDRLVAGGLCLMVMAAVAISDGGETWSPYYRIKVTPLVAKDSNPGKSPLPKGDAGYQISINDSFFQYALNLDPAFAKAIPSDLPYIKKKYSDSQAFYAIPYKLFKPRSVLILGAGSGNDAAMASQHGIERIVAVEIDPAIAAMGKTLHPQRPYNDPWIEIVIDDARHYLRTTDEKFDLVVYGLLDSHRLVSYISTVRLEGFVYTREGLEEAAARLNPGGAIVLTHASGKDTPQQARLFQTLERIFPGRVHGLFLKDYLWYTIIAGPESLPEAAANDSSLSDVTAEYHAREGVKIATDDWPFIYLTTKNFFLTPFFFTLVALVAASAALVRRLMPETGNAGMPLHFLLLGSGFLLLETKSIIDMSLLFGSTWLVNSVAIGAFLTMALLANLAVHVLKIEKPWPFYALLFAALAANALFPVERLLGGSAAARAIAGGGYVALPVFFSGIVFAISFRKTANPAAALGANIMGAVLGGFGEYVSLFTGYRFLFAVAAAFYLGSLIFIKRVGTSPGEDSADGGAAPEQGASGQAGDDPGNE